jgi:hypothetical protein
MSRSARFLQKNKKIKIGLHVLAVIFFLLRFGSWRSSSGYQLDFPAKKKGINSADYLGFGAELLFDSTMSPFDQLNTLNSKSRGYRIIKINFFLAQVNLTNDMPDLVEYYWDRAFCPDP